MKNRLTALIIFIGGLLMFFSCNSSPVDIKKEVTQQMSREELREHFITYYESQMKRMKIKGLSVALIDNEGVLLSRGFGYADKKAGTAVDETTLFPVGSITKTMTGIAVMQLVEQGKINLDTPISTYIDDLKLPGSEENVITPRMLLTHHSGIHGDIFNNWLTPAGSDPAIMETIVPLASEAGTIFTPGTMHSYCNSGYSLLGVLIHRVSGMPYTDYIHQNILEPLEMNDTILYPEDPTEARISLGYTGGKSSEMPLIRDVAAGNAAFSSRDAVRYLQAVIGSYNGSADLLSEKTMREMMRIQNTEVAMDEGFSIGLTWFRNDPMGTDTLVAAHGGDLPPFNAILLTMPEINAGLFISSNTGGNAGMGAVMMGIDTAAALYTAATGKQIQPYTYPAESLLTKAEAAAHEGLYATPMGPARVSARGSKLTLNLFPVPVELKHHEDDLFSLQARILGFIPLSIPMLDVLSARFATIEGKKHLIIDLGGYASFPGRRVEPVALSEDFRALAGTWQVSETTPNGNFDTIQLKYHKETGFIHIHFSFLGGNQQMMLMPTGSNSAVTAGIGRGMGEKFRWETGTDGKMRMYWSGLVLKRH